MSKEHAGGPGGGPEPIIQAGLAFYKAKHLIAASELGVFEALAEGPRGLDELAQATGVDTYRARIVADAMVASGFLEKEDGAYRNTTTAQTFLSGQGPADLRPLLTMWDRISHPGWGHFTEAIQTGQVPKMSLDEEEQRIFSEGIETITAPTAQGLTEAYDWSDHHRLLDIGGGTGSILKAILSSHKHLEGTVFELPGVAEQARKKLADLSSRAEVVEGNLFEGELPAGHDVVLMANTLHLWQPDKNLEALHRIRKSVEPGTRLLLADFWTGPEKVEPAWAALLAGEFFLVTGEGDVYSTEEATGWLEEAGFAFVERRPLPGAQSLIVAEAV